MIRLACALALLALAGCTDGLGVPDEKGQPEQQDAAMRAECNTLDENACRARSDCAVGKCDFCGGFSTSCYPASDPGPYCPAPFCPRAPCDTHKDEASCTADLNCVAVYADPGLCDCVGCCQGFQRCIESPPLCARQTGSGNPPPCVPIVCGPGYAPIYDGACQTGCVKASACDCRKTGCPGGTSCQECRTTWACLPPGNAC